MLPRLCIALLTLLLGLGGVLRPVAAARAPRHDEPPVFGFGAAAPGHLALLPGHDGARTPPGAPPTFILPAVPRLGAGLLRARAQGTQPEGALLGARLLCVRAARAPPSSCFAG